MTLNKFARGIIPPHIAVIPALAKNHGEVRPDESRLLFGGKAGIQRTG